MIIFCSRKINLGILTVLINTTKGINNTGYYRQYSKMITTLVFFVLSFLLFIPSPWRETYLFTRQVKVQIGKNTFKFSTSKLKMPTQAGNKQLFHPSLPSEDAHFPSFDRKWTVLIHRRWTSKWLFPRRHLVYSLGITNFLNCERKINWNNGKNEERKWSTKYMTLVQKNN